MVNPEEVMTPFPGLDKKAKDRRSLGLAVFQNMARFRGRVPQLLPAAGCIRLPNGDYYSGNGLNIFSMAEARHLVWCLGNLTG